MTFMGSFGDETFQFVADLLSAEPGSFELKIRTAMRKIPGRGGKFNVNPDLPDSAPPPPWDDTGLSPDELPGSDRWEIWSVLIARLRMKQWDVDVGLVVSPMLGGWKRIGFWRQMGRDGEDGWLFPVTGDGERVEIVIT